MNIDLRLGDCLEVLKTIPDNSIDSVVTDPPYGLEFMGKEWDTFKQGRIAEYKEGGKIDLEQIESRKGKGGAGPSYTNRAAPRCRKCGKQRWSGSPCKCEEPDFEIDNSTQHTFQSFTEAWARECYRVLKPGGHLLAFGGSRMYHRLACGVEDAGFEIRDQIMWVYGSGFPKSHNIGKAIDKRGGESIGWFGDWLKEWREENNIPQSKIAELFPSKSGGLTGCVSNWELGNNLPTNEQFNLICETFNLPFKSLEEAEREFIGTKTSGIGKAFTKDGWGSGHDEVEITKGNSDWEGWGTALKPAHEPIVMARKPLSEKSIAENVLKHGTGGINIDGSRIGFSDNVDFNNKLKMNTDGKIYGGGKGFHSDVELQTYKEGGRFPANIIFDEEAGKLLDEQSGKSKTKANKNYKHSKTETESNTFTGRGTYTPREDEGGASRFFYCPKASKKDRNEGLDNFEEKAQRVTSGGTRDFNARCANCGKKFIGSPNTICSCDNPITDNQVFKKKNHHPTVKPTDLMRYLINLITPPNGTVLDPFMGSGSTGKAAIRCGVNFVGIEKEQEYMEIAKARIEHERNKPVQKDLFD